MPRLSEEKPHFSHFIEWLLFTVFEAAISSVARKTNGRWADLFSTAGRTTELFEECFQRKWYQAATCYILVIAKLEGVPVSQYYALCLLKATLHESLYELDSELVRFLLRSGREYELATTDSDKLFPRFLGYFLCSKKNAHVASVKNILEIHASYLMPGKELSKLVAFVKGTQFDLVV
ncbi:Rab6A-GEF complex partner protein 1-like protein [Tanacetum coccineum]|uniref:Rab6A-GEF complex partner protein 1-like protein n=1 Tax=Tanacetum coccineum TaxID=301880 RepID=A0ABQ4XXB0_9ASTR